MNQCSGVMFGMSRIVQFERFPRLPLIFLGFLIHRLATGVRWDWPCSLWPSWTSTLRKGIWLIELKMGVPDGHGAMRINA